MQRGRTLGKGMHDSLIGAARAVTHVRDGKEEDNQEGLMAHQFFHFNMLQADELPDHQAYLNGCSTVMAFKTRKYLENLQCINQGVKINCN